MKDNNINTVVSFVIPLYNQGQFVYDAVASAYMSYSGQCEVIIVDDCSTDPRTISFLKEIQAIYPSTIIIRNTLNRGLSAARNTGIQASSGKFIQLLDADDIIIPGKVDLQIAHLSLAKNVDISITNYILSDESLSSFSFPTPSIGHFNLELKDFLYYWERGLSIPIHCALFRRDVLLKNPFLETIRAKEDWIFWCHLVSQGYQIAYLESLGVAYRQHRAAMTKFSKKKMGVSWITAALEIDKLLGNQEPNFFDSAVKWYNEIYSGEMDCAEESEQKQQDISNQVKEGLSNQKPILLPFDKKESSMVSQKYSVTVLIPIYNHYIYLTQCINSVISQLTSEVEILCIDDNSSDIRVKSFLSEQANKSQQIKIIENTENLGISSVLNQGIQNAKGDYIAFLDCDDYLAPGAISKVLEVIREKPEIDYFFSDRYDIDENGKFIRRANYGGYSNIHPSGNIASDLMNGMIASHLKVIRKSKIIEVGGYDPLLSGVQDWDLALKISESGKFFYITEPLYYHRIHSNSVTISSKASQLRKTNIVRRRFFTKRYIHNILPAEIDTMTKAYVQGSIDRYRMKDLGIFVVSDDEVSVETLKHLWSSYRLLIYDARKAYSLPWINFAREFNSFFDSILCENPCVMVSILPYLWDPKILYYPWKIRSAALDG